MTQKRSEAVCLGLGWVLTEREWDGALWMTSWMEGEVGTVKMSISSVCVLLCSPFHCIGHFPRGLQGPSSPHWGPATQG